MTVFSHIFPGLHKAILQPDLVKLVLQGLGKHAAQQILTVTLENKCQVFRAAPTSKCFQDFLATHVKPIPRSHFLVTAGVCSGSASG